MSATTAIAPAPDCSAPGAPAVRAADLKAGDLISVLDGAAVLTVQEAAYDASTGTTLLRVDTSPGPVRVPALDAVVVSDPQPPADRQTCNEEEGDEGEVTIAVALSVTEQVAYEFTVDVEVPVSATADDETLHDYLAENEELWLDYLDPVSHCAYVNERSLDQVSLDLCA
ncbi:hypothetical protein STHAL_32035 [Streptomyces halstedii]|uniref:Hint domain-containing protein n=1 Tax=Streptomyces halstedii TaxID=1944 RepID=A0ABS6U1G4_STRHA|nr:hypothetical protein [Streptomyces halstedii]MBV7674078.1 hypothetical protein [Streptomyces halstedii]